MNFFAPLGPLVFMTFSLTIEDNVGTLNKSLPQFRKLRPVKLPRVLTVLRKRPTPWQKCVWNFLTALFF